MTEGYGDPEARTEKLIQDITEKLNANRYILGRAPNGQMSWRWTNGKLYLEFRPTL